MSRNTLSQKGPGKPGKSSPPGKNRGVAVALAGLTAIIIVVIALIAVLSTTGDNSAGNFTPNSEGLLEPGSQAPDFTASAVNGGNVSVGDGGEEATMLVFFWSDCPHCQEEAPIISELEGEYEDLRIVMAGIDSRDSPETTREFVDVYDISSPAIYEPDLGAEYQVAGYPTVYFIDGSGEIVAANSGEANKEAYEGWAEEALAS